MLSYNHKERQTAMADLPSREFDKVGVSLGIETACFIKSEVAIGIWLVPDGLKTVGRVPNGFRKKFSFKQKGSESNGNK